MATIQDIGQELADAHAALAAACKLTFRADPHQNTPEGTKERIEAATLRCAAAMKAALTLAEQPQE